MHSVDLDDWGFTADPIQGGPEIRWAIKSPLFAALRSENLATDYFEVHSRKAQGEAD